MDDGSGKCLLDVISDPTALNEFLKSNSQLGLDGGELNDQDKTVQPIQRVSIVGQERNSIQGKTNPVNSVANNTLTTSLLSSVAEGKVPSCISGAGSDQKPVIPGQSLRSASPESVSGVRLSPALQNGRTNILTGHSNFQGLVRNVNTTAVSSAPRTFTNQSRVGNVINAQANPASSSSNISKASVATPVTFQGKKPIPIQPKNLLPGANITGASNIQANLMKGLQVVEPPSPAVLSNQTRMAQPVGVPLTSTSVILNGVENSKPRGQNLPQPVKTHAPVTQQILTTPPKRIAPKQQVLSPPIPTAIVSPSQVRMQMQPSNRTGTTPQKIQLPSQMVQIRGAVQGSAQSQTQLLPQQFISVVRQQQPQQTMLNIQPATIPTQTQTTMAKPVQHVQQIQQLVQQKLSVQQPQVTVQIQQNQHKVFTPAQLQAALKQTKLLAQNSPGQQPNIQVQQQIIRQLLLMQQKPQDKQQQSVQQQQQNVLQQLQQQQLKLSKQQTQVGQIQPKLGVANQQVAGVNQISIGNQPASVVNPQVTLANHVVAGNQQALVSQLIASNQQVIGNQTVASANRQMLMVGQNVPAVNQQGITVSQVVNSKQIPVTHSQNVSVCQAVIGQPQLVVQQNAQMAKNLVTTQAVGTPVGFQLQTLVDQQQKQLQQILAQSRTLQQPVTTISGNVQQMNQGKSTPPRRGVVNVIKVAGQQQTVQVQQQVLQPSVSQQNVLLQPKPTTTSQSVTTVQQLTVSQIQQLQNLGAVHKVLIIKQPELLQKLGMQGLKPQQTIQITAQQLQALKQIQIQQQPPQQKVTIQTKAGVSLQPTVLTLQQVKQIQQLQLHAGGSKTIQLQSQTQQGLLQKQVLAQQLQKQLSQQQTAKAQPKTSHLPRILQTSGRQPVVSSQVSQVKTSSVKQEPNRGIKRPHPETPEPPKVVTRIKSALSQDQQAALTPGIHAPFKSHADAVSKLIRYHVYHEPDPTPKDVVSAETLFNAVSTQLIKRSDKMMEKYRHLILEESMRNEPSSEMVMLYRVFLADERAALALERQQAAEDLKALETAALERKTESVNSPAAPDAKLPSSTLSTEPLTTCTTTSLTTEDEGGEEKIDVAMKSPLDVKSDVSFADEDEDISDIEEAEENEENEENEVDKAVHNMESSTSSAFFEGLSHSSSDSPLTVKPVVDSTRTNPGTPPTLECAEEMSIDDDGEKEDVTATLALLHSMAEELDDTIS